MSVKEVLPSTKTLKFPVAASVAHARGDLAYYDGTVAKSAAVQADQGTATANQRLFASVFAGVFQDTRLVGQDAAGECVLVTDGVFDVSCDSATFAIGDMVAAQEDSGGTFLENLKVIGTTDEKSAIGYVVQHEGSATTTVRVRLIGKFTPGSNARTTAVNPGDMDVTGDLSILGGGNLIFTGATGQSEINLTDNLADALSVNISGGNDFLLFKTTNAAEQLTILGDAAQKLAFFGAAGQVQGTAYTQTFATADKTHANHTSVTNTVGTLGGAADGAMETVGNTMAGDVSGAIMNNFQELFVQGNAIRVDLDDLKRLVNSVIDDLQAFGLVA